MLKDLVKNNRSHREFAADSAISKELLTEWVSHANLCPAAMNLQTLKYKLICDKAGVAALMPLTRWASNLDKKLPPEGHGPAAFVVICHDEDIAPQRPIFMIDAGICAQTIMLAATEAGFGGCIIGSADPTEVKKQLALPQNLTPVIILGLGRPEDNIVLTAPVDGSVKYYRDENNVHYVPKRPLEEIIVK